ncbi:MAG: thiamine pyrophosphate-binding protein [Syntrophaceae bacterium]|nr:thiamine pyrophosphate-binding protein [Syntrophaceae bacterium]
MVAENFLKEDVSVPEAIIRVLEEAGIDMVFGIPGGNAMHIFDALCDHTSTIRTVLVRHESLAGVMAEVYGRLTGLPGVAIGQGLFMMSNALLGVLEAHLGSTPMLLMTDLSDGAPYSHHAPYQSGTGEYGTWDAKRSFGGVTKAVMEARIPSQAVQNTQMAIKHATSGKAGPVALLYHSSSLNGKVGPLSVPHLYSTQSYMVKIEQWAGPEEIEAVVQLLGSARQPVIIAGNGVRIGRAYDQLQRVAELAGVPVATTASGKGVFPETHRLALGVFGTFGLPAANTYIAGADVILVAGSKLAPSDTASENLELIDPRRQHLIQIDIEPNNAGWTFPCEHVLIGDAASILSQISHAIEEKKNHPRKKVSEREDYVAAIKKDKGFFATEESRSETVPLLPQRIIAEIQEAISDDTIVTCDAGENRLFMTRFFQTRMAGTFLSPAATGGMGYAIPAALAAKLVFPERPAIAICGDGGFAMSMYGMLTACEENIPIVTVVFNNSALGWVKHFQAGREIASVFPDMNAAEIAKAMGCYCVRVKEPGQLATALKNALDMGVPAVVDVAASLDISFHDILSPLAKG